MPSKYPTREQILAELDYNPVEGSFTRKSSGAPSATYKNGYIYDYVCKRQVPRSILVWIVETGQEPLRRIILTERTDVTRFDTLKLAAPPRTRKRKWDRHDDINLAQNRGSYSPEFQDSFASERDFAWAVALLS